MEIVLEKKAECVLDDMMNDLRGCLSRKRREMTADQTRGALIALYSLGVITFESFSEYLSAITEICIKAEAAK